MIDQYFIMRSEVIDVVSEVASIALRHGLDHETVDPLREKVSTAFYKHYDLLPRTILNELVCLYMVLSDRDDRILTVKGRNIISVSDRDEIKETIKEISYYRNTHVSLLADLRNNDPKARFNAVVNHHARRVLVELSRTFSAEILDNLPIAVMKTIGRPEHRYPK